jgi:hypothetical protein
MSRAVILQIVAEGARAALELAALAAFALSILCIGYAMAALS